MKKLVFFIFLLYNYIYADITLTKDKFDGLLSKEIAIVTAIISTIEDKGIKPTTIEELKSNNYLTDDFESSNLVDGNNITFTVTNEAITIYTNIAVSRLDESEIDYYLNNVKSSIYVKHSNNETALNTTYYLDKKTINILNTNQNNLKIGNEEPISNQGDIWFDSNVKEFDIKKKIGSSWSDSTTTNQNLNKDGTFINPKILQMTAIVKDFTNVDIKEEQKAIDCRTLGATYNQQLNRCEAFTSDACNGLIFDVANGKCSLSALNYCNKAGYSYYDSSTGSCYNRTYVSANSSTTQIDCYHTCVWWSDAIWWAGTSHHTFGPDSVCGTSRIDRWWGGSYAVYRGSCSNNSTNPTDDTTWFRANKTVYSCNSGYTLSGTQCYRDTKVSLSSLINSNESIYNHTVLSSPSCSNKQMTVSPYSNTPHYGNNGICYSDTGLYCKTYATSTNKILLPNEKQIICWDRTQTCNDDRFNLSYDYNGIADKCSKFNYTCDNKSRYGLAEHPTFNNADDLFNRLGDNNSKNEKVLPYLTEIVNKEHIILNDNFGSMCVENKNSSYNPSSSNNHIIDGKTKSGF